MHNIGGTLIEHIKEHKLHLDLHPDDVVFHMNSNHEPPWKWFVSMMFSAKHMIMYDGSINSNFAGAMFEKLKQEGVTTLGLSGDYIEYLIEQEYFPMDNLPVASNILIDYYNEYIYDFIKNFITVRANITPVNICSDILGCISIPHYDLQNIIPVTLGADIKIIDDDGNLIEREIGNLACLTPLPSMPMRIIGDNKINEYYFNKTNQIWSNGDIIKIYGNKILKLYDSSL